MVKPRSTWPLLLGTAALLLYGSLVLAKSEAVARLVSANAHLAELGAAASLVGFVSFALVNMERHAVARAISTREPLAAPRSPPPLPPRLAARFDYPRSARPEARESEVDASAEYRQHRVELPAAAASEGTPSALTLEYFAPARPGRHPVAVILPIMSSNNAVERFFARGFAAEGMAAIVVTGGRAPNHDDTFEWLETALRNAVIGDRRVLDWIDGRPELDAGRIGVVGLSLGGIRGALLAAVDTRVAAAVLALAGGDMPGIVAASSERLMMTMRKAYMRDKGLSADRLTGALRDVLVSDPIVYAPHMDPGRIMLVLARRDTSVPYANGLALRSAMGKPETVVLPTGHYSSILFAPFMRDEALAFLKRRMLIRVP
jgi:dienelactone hydrolase